MKNIKDKIKGKAKAKVAAKLEKKGIAAKAAKTACVLLAAALCAVLAGCTTADAPTAQRAQSVTVKDCDFTFNIGGVASPTNALSPLSFAFEFGTAAQANETGDGESMTVTPTQTPTTTIPTRVDARYNDAAKAAGGVLETFLASLAPDSAAELKKFVASGKDGSLTVTKTDGTTDTVTCKGGVCSDSSGACLNCSD